MTFSESALAEATERGGERECPSCGAMVVYYAYEYAGPPNDHWEFVSCRVCRSNPIRRKWTPRQLRLEV